MKCAIYIRVSTKLQEDRYSLDAQERELTRYAHQQGWNVIGLFKDVDSGAKLNKVGLNSLLDLTEDQKIDVVLVIDQDRLSRLDAVEWEFLKSTLRENKVKIAEPGSITDLSNEDDEFVSDLKNLLARREKKTIVRRMMRGKKQRLIEGKGWGRPPLEYEYDKNTGTYKIKKDWAWVIPFIDNLYLNEQVGMKVIATKLNDISKSPTGNLWNEHLIHTRLTTKAYHGVSEKKFNGELITVENVYEIARTEDTFNKIQTELEKRRTQFKVTSRQKLDIHPFRRMTFTCGACGRKISILSHGGKYASRYYLKHGRKMRISDGSTCDISINTDRVVGNVLKITQDLLMGGDFARKYLNLETDPASVAALKADIKNKTSELNTLKASGDKLLDLYLMNKLDKDKYLDKEREINNRIETFTNQISEQQTKLQLIEQGGLTFEAILQYLETINDCVTDLTPLELANLFGEIFPSGIVHEDKLVLTANLSITQLEITVPIDADPFPNHFTKRNKK